MKASTFVFDIQDEIKLYLRIPLLLPLLLPLSSSSFCLFLFDGERYSCEDERVCGEVQQRGQRVCKTTQPLCSNISRYIIVVSSNFICIFNIEIYFLL